MPRLIDADPICEKCGLARTYNCKLCKVGTAITVDAVPVVRGRWLKRGTAPNVFYECSECYVIGSPAWRCCPVCTARMDLEVDV